MVQIGLRIGSVLLACAALAAQTTTHQTVRRHRVIETDPIFTPELTKAETAIEKKDYVAAEPLLEKVVAANPKNYQAWFDLGFVRNALDKTASSIEAYRKSVTAKPDVFESNLNLGLMLARDSQPEAEEFLRAATKLKPSAHIEEGKARAWLSLGHVLESAKPEEAIEAYKQAAALRPKDPEPHLASAPLLEKLGRTDEAEQAYKLVLAQDPNSADALSGLVNLYMRAKRFGEAEELLRRLALQRPEEPVVHIQLGRILAASGKRDEAITELETGLKLAPNDAEVIHDLADLYTAGGRYAEAEAKYRPLLASAPDNAELRHALGHSLLMQRKFPEAQQELIAALKVKPDMGQAYWDLAVAASENKDYPLAIQAVDLRAKLLPETPLSYFLRATSYDHLRDKEHAAENYHRFLEVAGGKYPDQEWQARHRLIAIVPKNKR